MDRRPEQPDGSPVPLDKEWERFRDFLAGVYGRAGKPREPAFHLVHIYGTRVTGFLRGHAASEPQRHVLPVTLANEARVGDASGGPPLLHASLTRSGRDLALALVFSFAQLRATVPAGETAEARDRRGRLIAAWRALHELRHAAGVRLHALFFRFDHGPLLGKGAESRLDLGLVPADVQQDWSRDIDPQRLREWLDENIGGEEATLGPILLPREVAQAADAARLHLVRIELELTRPLTAAPVGTPELVRARLYEGGAPLDGPDRYDAGGRKVDTLAAGQEDPDPYRVYASWRDARTARRQPVLPRRDLPSAGRAAPLRVEDLFAGGGEDEPAAWHAPPDRTLKTPAPPLLVTWPLSFVPLAPHGLFGARTSRVARRYFEALTFIVDCAPAAWNADLDPADWRTHFEALAAALDRIADLRTAAAGLLVPAHSAADVALPEEVRASMASLGGAVGQALARMLERTPGLFGTAKAFLVSHLLPGGQTLRPDLLRFARTHAHVPPSASRVAETIRLQRLSDFRDAFPWRAGAEVVLLETLDDEAYGTEFVLDDARVSTFEVLAQATPPSGTTATIEAGRIPGAAARKHVDPAACARAASGTRAQAHGAG